MRIKELAAEKVFDAGPIAMTVLVVILVAGLGLGAFAFAGRDTHPAVVSAQITADGSDCSIALENHGGTALQVDSILLSTQSGGNAVSFSSGFVLPPRNVTTYSCDLGSRTQFVPPLASIQGGQYNITVRLADDTRLTYSSQFS